MTKIKEINGGDKGITTDQVQLDPNLYGYSTDQSVEFPGNAMLYIATFAKNVAQEETNVVFDTTQVQEGDGEPRFKTIDEIKATQKETITDKGLMAMEIYNIIMSAHMMNVNNGVAKHQNVLYEENAKQSFSIAELEKED